MNTQTYQALAERLNALPNGFPSTASGSELRLLARLFSPEEAALTAHLRLTLESAAQIAARTSGEPRQVRQQLKDLARRGLISAGRVEGGLGYGLMPFVVGFYENQSASLDAELAQLFEDYFRESANQIMDVLPSVHRVIPVNESVPHGIEIQPYESAAQILSRAQAWGVVDCICRKQKALIGQPCKHPVHESCMIFSDTPGAFNNAPDVKALTFEQASAALRHFAEIGLVHTLSNKQNDLNYICNCCTCSCGVLRGLAEMGHANVVAPSAFLNQVDDARCNACGACVDACSFGALTLEITTVVNDQRCVGCGVCVLACPEGALSLARRPQVQPIPETETEWRQQRAAARGLDLQAVL